MNFFQKTNGKARQPTEYTKSNSNSLSQTVYPNICRQIDSSQLVKHPSKLQLYAAIKSQNLTDDISEYFGEFHPLVLENDEVDSLLLTKLLGWSEDVIANPDKDIEIIVGQKFIKTNSEPSTAMTKNPTQTTVITQTVTKTDMGSSQIDHPFATNVSQFDEFLKKTYENYCKNFQGEKSKIQQQELHPIGKSGPVLPKMDFAERRSHLHSRLSESLNNQIYLSKHRVFLEADESVDDVIEEVTYLPNRLHAHTQASFCGFHCLQHSKSDKLTATTMASVGGFFNAEENCFD